MSDKKLTRVQKEILTTLRDVPGAKIVSIWRGGYELVFPGISKGRAIQWSSFLFLKTWLNPVTRERGKNDYYTFRQDAEISDAWRAQEIERQRVEAQQKQDERERKKEEEYQALVRRLRNVFTAIERGEIDNRGIELGYTLRFKCGGKWYSLSEEE